ncbi:MAG: hypothetical protein Kow0032_16690 [Methyloligellaceae bacterium]
MRGIAVIAGLGIALLGIGAAAAQQAGFAQQSDLDLPLSEYLRTAGPDVKLVEPGALRIDGARMICGKRPTVIDPGFESWGGAYPGYLILNPKRMEGLSTVIKMFIYAHECGHQFIGRDEDAADCFAVKRGRRYGWLGPEGLEEVCTFMAKLKGDWDHAAGPDRCRKMKICYEQAAPRAADKKR